MKLSVDSLPNPPQEAFTGKELACSPNRIGAREVVVHLQAGGPGHGLWGRAESEVQVSPRGPQSPLSWGRQRLVLGGTSPFPPCPPVTAR